MDEREREIGVFGVCQCVNVQVDLDRSFFKQMFLNSCVVIKSGLSLLKANNC